MLAVAISMIAQAASAADVHVMISAGFYGVYSELGPTFEQRSAHRLVMVVAGVSRPRKSLGQPLFRARALGIFTQNIVHYRTRIPMSAS
jgi:hypothetical protein